MGSVIPIQMPLRGEGVPVWRPVASRPLGGDLFLVDPQSIPETEDWAFAPGDVVRCLPRAFADGALSLAAVAQVPQEPATLQAWLELHDSVPQRVEPVSTGVVLRLDGYVHRWESRAGVRFGLGLTQPIVIHIREAVAPAVLPTEVRIADGSLSVSGVFFRNLISLPCRASGTVHLSLEFSDGTRLDATGTDCEVTMADDGRFVEVLPPELEPRAPA